MSFESQNRFCIGPEEIQPYSPWHAARMIFGVVSGLFKLQFMEKKEM